MIAVSGFKVFPSQIEAVLHHHPAIREALVVGLPDSYRGEAPHAYVTVEEAADVTGERLREWLNPQLGRHERVDRVVIRAALPKTMIGKLSRKDLLAEIAAERAEQAGAS
jgi:long-chain acyl-CoA synthetase